MVRANVLEISVEVESLIRLSQISARLVFIAAALFSCSVLSPAAWFAARFLCLASVFFSRSDLPPTAWLAARLLCLASVPFTCSALSPASWFAARRLTFRVLAWSLFDSGPLGAVGTLAALTGFRPPA